MFGVVEVLLVLFSELAWKQEDVKKLLFSDWWMADTHVAGLCDLCTLVTSANTDLKRDV